MELHKGHKVEFTKPDYMMSKSSTVQIFEEESHILILPPMNCRIKVKPVWISMVTKFKTWPINAELNIVQI